MNPLEYFIGDGLKTLFGDPLTGALVCLFFFVLLIIVTGMDLSVGAVILVPLLVVLTAYQGFPQWALFLIALGCGGVIYLAIKSWLVRPF